MITEKISIFALFLCCEVELDASVETAENINNAEEEDEETLYRGDYKSEGPEDFLYREIDWFDFKPTDEKITFDNFFVQTVAVFEETVTPGITPNYISQSGSIYWYGTDEGGDYVIRRSDHWSSILTNKEDKKQFNAYPSLRRAIASCKWAIEINLQKHSKLFNEINKEDVRRINYNADRHILNILLRNGNNLRREGVSPYDMQPYFKLINSEGVKKANDYVVDMVNKEYRKMSLPRLFVGKAYLEAFTKWDTETLHRTSEEIEAEYPNWLEGTTTESGKHSTQVEGTRKTYNKVGTWIEENIGKDVSILDASSGMGYGTADLRERGFNIEDVEPYQSEERKQNNPATFSSYEDIDKQYDFIISNAVLNVIPDDWRADVLHNMADKLKAGGKMFINTRKTGEERFIKDKIELDSPQEVLVKRNGKIASYQRFFTPQELKEWVEHELGEGYTVEVANDKNSGTKGLAAVVVTKNNESPANGKTFESGQPISTHKGMANASLTNFSAKVGKNAERANKLDKIISSIEEIGEMGPHEFLHEIVNAMLLSNNISTDVSRYAKLGGGVTLRLSDHYGNASNYKGLKDEIYNYGLVVKLSSKAFIPDKSVDYLEYVYFPDKLTKERQIEIVQGLKAFMETGRYELLPTPDKVNPSGKFRDEYNREGEGAYTDDEVRFENDPISKVLGKPRFTRKQRREFAERERQRMVERVESLAKKLHLDNVEVVTDASQLEGKKQRAKGFYSKSTGKITIVIPNHSSAFDVEQTLLHEAVAHYGLRQLFGEHFDTFLDNVFNNADEAIRQRIVALAAKNGWDFRKATEEYLAMLAENTEFENTNASWWRQIKDFFLNMLHKIGFEDFRGVTLTDNELRYILWRSYENLAEPGRYRSILGEAADVAKQYELGVGNYAVTTPNTPHAAESDDELFRGATDKPQDYERALVRDRYEKRLKTSAYQSQEALQDSMLSVKTFMEQVVGEKTYIEDIAGYENAYMGENRLSSVNKAEAERYGKFVNEVFLNIRNPYEVDYNGAGWQGWSGAADGMQRASTDSYADLLANGSVDSALERIIENYGRVDATHL